MRSAIGLGSLLAGAALVAACTAGSGPAKQLGAGTREPGGSTQEPGSTGPEPATGSQESPGSNGEGSGGGGSGGAGACPKCDFVYACVTTQNGKSDTNDVDLVTQNGRCVIPNTGSGSALFDCNGTLEIAIVQGSAVTTQTVPWTSDGNGGFVVTVNGVTTACTPKGPFVQPQPSPSGGGSPQDGG